MLTVAEGLIVLLEGMGVKQAFGVIGGSIACFCRALAESSIEVMHCRHETGAAFMATEASLATDRPVVVFSTAGPGLTNTMTGALRRCCEGAAEEAGLSLRDIDFFVFNTPTGWFTSFATEVLGIERSRTVNAYPRYGNIGPALTTANLYLAASEGHLQPGDTVLLYSIGSVSTASAAVIRWGDVRLGATPEPGLIGTPRP